MLYFLLYDSTDFFALHDAKNVFRVAKCKDNDRHMIIHGKRCSGRVHDHQVLAQDIIIADHVIFDGRVILIRISRVNAVNIFSQKNGVSTDLNGTECGTRIR